MSFMNESFLLGSETARSLYGKFAKDLPIIDYHCHIDPKEIAENKVFTNLSEIWLSGDHYKWRLMRAAGIDEKFITGSGTPKEKFIAWGKVIGRAVGSPLYHWNALELYRYFGISDPLTEKNAGEIFDITSKMMADDPSKYSARGIIKASDVEILCTTDDPCDDLRWHKMIREDSSFDTRVLPSFRPDPILDIEKDTFPDYIKRLEDTTGIKITDPKSLLAAIDDRIGYFADNGCKIADHGLQYIVFEEASEDRIAAIMDARKTRKPDTSEIAMYKTFVLLHCARRYSEYGLTMQLHFGVIRDVNKKLFDEIGINCGCDTIGGSYDQITPLTGLLSRLTEENKLPRTILYSLDPNDNTALDTLIGCYRNVTHGAAWWFNDNLNGMRDHMRSLSCQGFLPSFTGMLTDSRSFLSYTRHEYFRRILCSFLAEQVDAGLFAMDEDILKGIVEDICYGNARKLF